MVDKKEINSAAGPDALFRALRRLRGERPGDEAKRAYSDALNGTEIRRVESLADFLHRRHEQFEKAARYGYVVPDRMQARMLEEGARLLL